MRTTPGPLRLVAAAVLAAAWVAAAGCSSSDGANDGLGGHVGSGGSGGNAGSGSGGKGGGAGGTVVIGSSGCPLFTADDAWNTDISGAAVDSAQSAIIAAAVTTAKIHPDFGPGFGIPFNVVSASQAAVPVMFDQYPDESDPGPYPFPDVGVARVEGTDDPHNCSGDCHLLAVQMGTCMLYEGYACHYDSAKGWICGNGAKWDLKKKSFGQRPEGWTSVDAAGLPVYAGLARYEEVMAGEITHALRFTMSRTAGKHIAPATHDAGSATNAPPMGLRVRLKASYDGSALAPAAQVFVRAMKKYGMILADNGSNFYFQSEDNPNWPDGINDLKMIPASAFEAIVSP
jgi:hypothetical protein